MESSPDRLTISPKQYTTKKKGCQTSTIQASVGSDGIDPAGPICGVSQLFRAPLNADQLLRWTKQLAVVGLLNSTAGTPRLKTPH